MLPRDERRFQRADLDGDAAANREEFTSFLHPEEFEHMKDIVVLVSPCDQALINTCGGGGGLLTRTDAGDCEKSSRHDTFYWNRFEIHCVLVTPQLNFNSTRK